MIRRLWPVSESLRRITSTWGPVLAWMAVIFILSSIPSLGDPTRNRWKVDPHAIAHLTVFAALGFLTIRGMLANEVPRAAWWAVVVGVVYAVSDEIHQSFVPGRTPSIMDVITDGVGVLMGMLVWRRIAATDVSGSLRRAVRLRSARQQ